MAAGMRVNGRKDCSSASRSLALKEKKAWS